MANVTGIDLNPILQRLNSTNNYHPFDAETFSDWATEAGDIVTISRNGETYVSPVHTSRMVWKGKAPTMQISTTGNEKRDAVSRVSRKKYGRGSAGLRSNEQIHRNFYSEDGILHSELHITESYLRTEFHDETNSLRSYFDMTASHMRTEFLDQVHSLRGEFDVTASHLRTEFEDDVNSLRGEFEVTASHLRTEFEDDVNSLRGEFEVTASHLRTDFEDNINSLRGEFEVTASHLRTEFDDGIHSLRGEFEVTASGLRTEFEDDVNSVRSYVHQTASSWEARVAPVSDANGNVTPASIALAINSAGSEARINADRIYLLGQTIADTVDANYISTKVAEIPHLYTNHITMDGDLTLGGRLVLLGVNVTSLVSSVKSVRISGPTNNTYKLQYTTYDDDSWQDAGTFSRATTLSGAWSGRQFTVTASPQGNIKSGTVYETIVPDTSDSVAYNANTKQLSRLYYVYSEDENGDADSVILHKTVSIPGDLAYAAGFTDGSASGGSTNLTATWAGGKITVTASPQGETLERLLQAGAVTWSGTRATIPISSVYGSSGQYSDGVVFTPFVDVSSKLQTKTITSNGTVNPDAGYIGFGSVTVAVPTTNAGARFNAAEGSYFVEAYDRTSGTSITGSSVTYKLAKSGNKVQIQNASSVQLSSTPEYDMSTDLTNAGYAGRANVTLNDPTWNPVTGATPTYRTVTVTTSGRTNASGTTDNLSKSVALYLTQGNWNSNKLTVSMRAGGTSGTVYASTTVDASTLVSNATTAGKNSAKVTGPTWATNPSSSITGNSNTATFTTDAASPVSGASKSLALYMSQGDWSSNKKYVYMHHTNSEAANRIARYEVDASSIYTNGQKNGWSSYWNRLQYPKAKTNAGTPNAACMTAYYPNGTYDSAFDSVAKVYTISSGDNTAYMKDASGNVMAEITHNKYTNGKADGNTAAGVTASWSGNVYTVTRAANTATKSYTCTVTVNTPSFTYNTSTHKYTATAIAYGNAEARQTKTNDSGTEAYNDGYNSNHSGWIAYGKDGATSNQGYLGVGNYIHAYTNNINGVSTNSGGYWWVSSAWFRYVNSAGSNHQGDLASNSYIELIYTNSDASGDVRGTGATWHVPQAGSSYSHSVTLTRYRAGAVEGSYAGQMYRRNANGSYQALGSQTSMWYECKTNLGSSKTVYYN